MPRSQDRIRALLIASGEAQRAAFKAAESKDIEAVLHPLRQPAVLAEEASGFDVVLIDLDNATDLQLISSVCALPDAPAVIAIASRGFSGKPLEYVLVMAEIRGASATVAGEVDTVEFRHAIRAAASRRQSSAGPARRTA
jgi:predicted O-methyltransferase YrrM